MRQREHAHFVDLAWVRGRTRRGRVVVHVSAEDWTGKRLAVCTLRIGFSLCLIVAEGKSRNEHCRGAIGTHHAGECPTTVALRVNSGSVVGSAGSHSSPRGCCWAVSPAV